VIVKLLFGLISFRTTFISGIIIGAVLILLGGTLYTVKQWEKAAIMRFGKLIKIVGPGLHTKIPFIDSVVRVDLRTKTIDLSGQSAITKDNISVGIDAVAFIRVEDPERVLLKIIDYTKAISNYAQTAIRNIVGQYTLDTLLESREEAAKQLKKEVDDLSKEWGIDVARVGLQDIVLPEDMKRAFAVQAEAEREAKAVQIKANAELEASSKLKKAAKNMTDPNAMQLRILSTINDVSKDQSNTIILALPLETLRAAGVSGVLAAANAKMTPS